MANPTYFPGDGTFNGQVSAASFYSTNPGGWLTNAMVTSGAAIAASKLIHQYEKQYSNTDGGTNAVSEQRVIHVVFGATATLTSFKVGNVVALTGNDTCTIDLWKNGSTILTGVVSLLSTTTAYTVLLAGTFTGTASVVGDVYEVKVTATHNTGTLPKGVFAELVLTETPS